MKKLILLVFILILSACGGGGSGSSPATNKLTANASQQSVDKKNTSKSEKKDESIKREKGLEGKVTLTFVHGLAQNLKFKTDKGKVGNTNSSGEFDLEEDENEVNFYIQTPYFSKYEETKIASIKREDLNTDRLIFIQDLVKVKRTDISDNKVLEIADLLQAINKSTESDKIYISPYTNKELKNTYDSIEKLKKSPSYKNFQKKLTEENRNEAEKLLKNSLDDYDILKKKLTDNPYFDEQWYINPDSEFITKGLVEKDAHINPEDYLEKYSGKGVKIAIIDSDLDLKHKDLEGRIVKHDVVSKNYSATTIHGTAVAGIIAANDNEIGIKGIASSAQIAFFRLKGKSDVDGLIGAFDKAEKWGADIINASWGHEDFDPRIKAKIQKLAKEGRNNKGIIFVFAAGNSGKKLEKESDEEYKKRLKKLENANDESNIPEVISVGATDEKNNLASYSSPRKYLDILAPGGRKDTLGITTLNYYGNKSNANASVNYKLAQSINANTPFSGTSAAAPIVSSIIALMLEKKPSLSREEIERILKASADKIGEDDNYSKEGCNIGIEEYDSSKTCSPKYGYGKVNLAKAMELIEDL